MYLQFRNFRKHLKIVDCYVYNGFLQEKCTNRYFIVYYSYLKKHLQHIVCITNEKYTNENFALGVVDTRLNNMWATAQPRPALNCR